MKPTIPKPLPDGSIEVATLPKGTVIKPYGAGYIAVHPDHEPLIIHADGTTETLKATLEENKDA